MNSLSRLRPGGSTCRVASSSTWNLSSLHRMLVTVAESNSITSKTTNPKTSSTKAFVSTTDATKSLPFRPRNRTPKHLTKVPPPKYRRGGNKAHHAPNVLSGEYATEEERFGEATSSAMNFLRKTEERKGSIGPHDRTTDPEAFLRAADYMTAEMGSTEDLVFERRAMELDGMTPEEGVEFKKNLEKFVEMQSQKTWKVNPLDEHELDEQKEKDSSAKTKATQQQAGGEDYKDPNQKAYGDWSETIVRVDRVQKVQRGGTLVRYRALVVGGNLNGCAGFGIAKANTPNDATANAARMAKRNIFFVDRYKNTGLTGDLVGKQNSCKVYLRSVSPNRGLKGHPLVLEILKYFGITDCSAKSHGNRNVHNVVRATFKALMTHESLEDIALKRGKRLLSLEQAKRLGI